MGVALTALALLALAWSPLGAEASRALMEGDGARLPRRDGALGVAPSADGWEDEVPESSAGLASDVYWRRRSRVTRARDEDVGEEEINWRALKVLHRLEESRADVSRAEATAADAAAKKRAAAVGDEDRESGEHDGRPQPPPPPRRGGPKARELVEGVGDPRVRVVVQHHRGGLQVLGRERQEQDQDQS